MLTTTKKDRDGWSAKTDVPLQGKQTLRITTQKDDRGLKTWATVVEVTECGYQWDPLGAFQETLRVDPGVRCTERNVTVMQQRALVDVEAIKARAVAFYAAAKAA